MQAGALVLRLLRSLLTDGHPVLQTLHVTRVLVHFNCRREELATLHVVRKRHLERLLGGSSRRKVAFKRGVGGSVALAKRDFGRMSILGGHFDSSNADALQVVTRGARPVLSHGSGCL